MYGLYRAIRGDTRSLDYSSYSNHGVYKDYIGFGAWGYIGFWVFKEYTGVISGLRVL